MPDNIIIDNHHVSYWHVHPKPEKHYLKEKYNIGHKKSQLMK
ncbi:hypothetical protein MBCUT_13070 [Methanobrevibacter cuticularis]|uniref:Uncharacterized protein n=1 Tax=Methanobrevibacter cuticularis TaxID=47311 RepID=A0A166DNY2_9EURY|nr:hypothetical protein [Methanobrevibacter cuticularis]KZX15803.1 hypothetical protein MBCUT_13070 [Methanobrevibacter cuticularis]